jgi:hypothetical protein
LLPVPVEIRPHVGAALAAGLADETMLYVGQAKVIGPLIGADRDAVAAAIVDAMHQDTPRNSATHSTSAPAPNGLPYWVSPDGSHKDH